MESPTSQNSLDTQKCEDLSPIEDMSSDEEELIDDEIYLKRHQKLEEEEAKRYLIGLSPAPILKKHKNSSPLEVIAEVQEEAPQTLIQP